MEAKRGRVHLEGGGIRTKAGRPRLGARGSTAGSSSGFAGLVHHRVQISSPVLRAPFHSRVFCPPQAGLRPS
ncbi:hypothetical protein D4764_15G0003690 [Takifugu flavidus]|uniref:Uncharacterized protein n=1 Tax=Takifugu flavidus TaxID=433684 RepID=A0A5C6P0Z6_9TELE|nr:hypothetical protein D4764_15G0003690 [Takifugu flavidus]